MTTRRRSTAGTPRALDPVRARRASQQTAQGRLAGPGQTVDTTGRIVPDLGDVSYVDRNGKQQIRIDEASLQIVTGSPKRIAARTKPADVEQVAVEATEARSELDARLTGILTNHEGRIGSLESAPAPVSPERGIATLSSGRATVSSALILSDETLCTVILTRKNGPGSSPGHLYYDSVSDNSGFTIESTDGSDDGDVHWTVIT